MESLQSFGPYEDAEPGRHCCMGSLIGLDSCGPQVSGEKYGPVSNTPRPPDLVVSQFITELIGSMELGWVIPQDLNNNLRRGATIVHIFPHNITEVFSIPMFVTRE